MMMDKPLVHVSGLESPTYMNDNYSLCYIFEIKLDLLNPNQDNYD